MNNILLLFNNLESFHYSTTEIVKSNKSTHFFYYGFINKILRLDFFWTTLYRLEISLA